MFFTRYEGKLSKIFLNPRIWQNNFLVYNFFASFTLLLIIWGEVIWALFSIKNTAFLSLHYSIYFGVDWLGGPAHFFIFPGIATLIFIINFILSNIFYDKKKISSYFLSSSVTLLQLFMLVAVSLIIYINWTATST